MSAWKSWILRCIFGGMVCLSGMGALLVSQVKENARTINVLKKTILPDLAREGITLSVGSVSWRVTSSFPFIGLYCRALRIRCVLPTQSGRSPAGVTWEIQAPEAYGHINLWSLARPHLAIQTLELRKPQIKALFAERETYAWDQIESILRRSQHHSARILSHHIKGFEAPALRITEGTLQCRAVTATHTQGKDLLQLFSLNMLGGRRHGYPFCMASGFLEPHNKGFIRISYATGAHTQPHIELYGHHVKMVRVPLVQRLWSTGHPFISLVQSTTPLTGTLRSHGQVMTFEGQMDSGSISDLSFLVKRGHFSGVLQKHCLAVHQFNLDCGSRGIYDFKGKITYDPQIQRWIIEGKTHLKNPLITYWLEHAKKGLKNPWSSFGALFTMRGLCLDWFTQGRLIWQQAPSQHKKPRTPFPFFFSQGSLKFDRVMLQDIKSLQLLAQDLQGSLTYTSKTWSLHLDQGQYGLWALRAMDLSWDHKQKQALFKGKVTGTWKNLMGLLSQDDLAQDLRHGRVDGQIDALVQGEWELGPTSQKPRIRTLEGRTSNVHMSIPWGEKTISCDHGQGTLQVTEDKIFFKGYAESENTPIQIRWTYDLLAQPFARHMFQVRGEFDVDMLKQWGYNPHVYFGQKALYRLSAAAQSKGVYDFLLSLDLTSSSLTLPWVSWFKLPGLPARLHFKGTMSPELLSVSDAVLTGPSLHAEGECVFDWTKNRFQKVILRNIRSAGYDVAFSITPSEHHTEWHLDLSGEQFRWDASQRNLWDVLQKHFPIGRCTVSLNKICKGKESDTSSVLRNMTGDALFKNGQIWQAHLEAQSGTAGHSVFRVTPPNASTGDFKASLTSSDGGALISFFEGSQDWHHGQAYIEARRARQDSQWIGYAHFKDTVVGRGSLPFRLVSSAFPQNANLSFAEASHLLLQRGGADFMYDGTQWHIGRGFFENALMHVTFEGMAASERLSLQGHIMPLDSEGAHRSHYTLTGPLSLPVVSFVDMRGSHEPLPHEDLQVGASPSNLKAPHQTPLSSDSLFEREQPSQEDAFAVPPPLQPIIQVETSRSQRIPQT